MDSQLLVTKIIVPTPRADELRRPRLLDFIHEYIDRKLLLIAASAGYGKTSLLTDFAHDTALPVCWYSLDASDADPHAFLSYLVAAIQLRFPHFGGRTQALLERFDASSLDALVGALVQDLYTQIDSFFVLVLDDYHTVEDSEPVNRVLDRLLGYLPENVHLILASRTIPSQLTLTRLTAQRQVAGIGVGDLRFTADEVRALMQQQRGLDMPAPEAHELAIRSEGWIAGIILTTPDFWRGLFELQVGGAGPGTQLFEYLATQVLSQQPPELHRFLLESSVLPEMYPAWCDEICGRADAAALLDLAERRNLFITRLQDHGYRYHNLFREFLAAQLRQTQPARRRELEQRVAALYERHGKLDQAVDQWLAVEEYDAAARILEITAQEHYELGRWTALARRLNALPDAVLETHPALQRQRAILLAESGDTQRAQLCFESAARVLEHRGDSLNLARTLIESARYVNDVPEGIAICERALALLPRREFALHALACRTMGVLQARADDFSRAIPLFERASGLYEIANDRALQADAESGLGGVYLDVGDRARATLHLNKALMYWRNLGLTSKLANTLNSIGIARYQEGRLDEGHDLLQEALTNARASGHLKIEAYVHASLGEVYRDQGDLVRALQSFSQAADLAEKIRERYLITFARVAIGDVWRLSGDLGTAERVLQTAFQAASAHHSDYQIALVQVAMAALRLAQGETGSAVRHLDQALPLLEQPHAKRDLARAHLYRAVAAQRRGHVGQALIHLRRVAAIGKALGESQFLARDVALAQPSVELALARRVGATFYKKVKHLAPIPVALVNVSELAPAFPQLELQVLGHSRVLMNGQVIEKSAWQTAATKELFLFFASHPRGWRKEQVIEQIWPNMLRRQGSDLFHSTLYRVRRALFPECLTFHNGLYQINAEVVRCMDENEFVTAVAEGGQAEQPLDRIDALERAVKLYRGDFLDDIYSDWCIPRRDQLLQRYLDALALIAQSWTELGDVSQAVSYYRRILRREPLHEATYCKLIELYARSGDRTSAVQTYQQCVSMLASELGVPPMPETQALYRRCVEYA